MRIIYDTNILLQILRSSGSMGILQDMFGSEYVEEYISNDLWIAATASAYQCSLLTMDLDFRHLQEEFLDVIYIDSFTLR